MGNKYLAAIILGLTLPVIATGCKKSETTLPVVAVQPAAQDDVTMEATEPAAGAAEAASENAN